MELRLIFGASGSGKTEYILNDVINKSVAETDDSFILIVPEQFTMETQKNIISHHPRGGTMNIDIQSFIRLAQNVFDELGINVGTILDDTGKTLILRNVIEQQKDILEVFGNKVNKPGFVEELKSIISEFYQYGIEKEEILELVNNNDIKPLLRAKLKDVQVIFEAFERYIGNEYIPSEELLQVFCDNIEKSSLIRNSEFYIDGFTGFTPIQYRVVELLIKYSKKVSITLTLPSYKVNETKELEQDLFLLPIKTKNRLLNIASELRATIADFIIIEDNVPKRFVDSDMLAFLEKNIFRYTNKVCESKDKDISIISATNPKDEVTNVVYEIKELIRTGKYQYRDMAIVTGDIDRYYRLIERELDSANIPFFIDNKKSIISNPFVDAIRGAIQIIEDNFSYESVFRYLRTGMADFTMEDIDILENQVIAMGIRGYKKWQEEWENVPERINKIRAGFIENFTGLKENISGKRVVRDVCIALYDFICSSNMEDKLNSFIEKFENENKMSLVKEYSQVYKYVMDMLDKMVALMGNTVVSLNEFGDILDAGFEEIKVGLIPMSMDCIVAGDIQRTRLNNIKVLFFVGVNDGVIPKVTGSGGILNESDRKNLSKYDIELAPTARENAFIQKYYLYLNMTKPKNKLYISYSSMDNNGKALRASYLINEVKKLYLNMNIGSTSYTEGYKFVTGESAAINFIADEIRDMSTNNQIEDADNRFKELYAKFYGNKKYHSIIDNIIDAAYYRHYDTPIDKAIAKAMYGEDINTSISRLEKFAACAYSHFLKYGLELRERKMFEIKVSDIGSIYHSAIEIFSKIVNSNYDWHSINDVDRKKIVQEAVEKAVEESGVGALKDSARNKYMIERVGNMTDKTTKVLCEQLRVGKFEPEYFEFIFSTEAGAKSMCMKLDDYTNMNLRGIIDRVDVYKEISNDGKINKVYIKIIDYKSGKKDFDIEDVFDGRQLQLSMYMRAMEDVLSEKYNDAEIIPAAELYYNIQDPYIDKYNEDGIDDSSERRGQEYRMLGLVNNSEEILELIDKNIIENGSSDVIKAGKLKNGTIKVPKGTSSKGFEALGDFVVSKAVEIGKEIVDGNIDIHPYKSGIKTPCEYCEFSSICRFDLKLSGYEYRDVVKQKSEDIWKEIMNNREEVNLDGK